MPGDGSVRRMLEEKKGYLVAEYRKGRSTCDLARELGCSNGSVWILLRSCGEVVKNSEKSQVLSDDELREMHTQGRSAYSISKEYGLSNSSLCRRFASLGLSIADNFKKSKVDLKPLKGEIVAKLADGKSRETIAREIGCGSTSISRILKKEGLEGSVWKYHCDETFFDAIDREDKAYVLGLFTADGYNGVNKMALSMIDEDIIQKVKVAIGSDSPIAVINPTAKSKMKQRQYKLSVCSTRICDALDSIGCPRNKTFVTRFPDRNIIPESLLHHYIRGVFDGDGCLLRTTNGWHVTIAGTVPLVVPMLDHIRSQVTINGGVYKQGKIHVLKIGGNRQVRTFLDWLYADANIYMDRKFAKYQEMLATT